MGIPVDVVNDWVDYAVALGTLAAVVVALALGFFEVARYRSDQRQRGEELKARHTDARRAQAEAVSAWVPASRPDAAKVDGVVRNAFDRPAYEVAVLPGLVGDNWHEIGFLPPHGEERFEGVPMPAAHAVPVRFRDAAGLWWIRDRDGQVGGSLQMRDGKLVPARPRSVYPRPNEEPTA